MRSRLHAFLRDRHHKHPVRRAIWDTLARIGATGMHALPLSRRWIEVHRQPMPLLGLDPSLHNLRLIQISDLHYSPVVWRKYIEQFIDIINDLSPDLIVITGDLITGGYPFAARIARILSRLHAPLGIVVTFGNHDYSMWGKRSPAQATKRGDYLERAIESQGIIVLRNEVLRITRPTDAPPESRQYHLSELNTSPPGALTLVGLDDEWTGKINPDLAFSHVSPDEPIICLNHNPINARELLHYPWQWMLAGHTHGRQIGHKGLSKKFLPHKLRPFTHGYYELAANKHLYVNRGLSYGQRTQDWCRPEVTIFKLHASPPLIPTPSDA